MSYMFKGCTAINKIYLRELNTSNVTDMRGMFFECWNLNELYIDSFDTSNVTNMNYMFYNSGNISATLTIKGVNKSYSNMLYNAADSTDAQIVLNYTSQTLSLVNSMVASKSEKSNVIKGTQQEYSIYD